MPFSRTQNPKNSRIKGFTLVELLVALFVFSLLTLFAYRAINTLMQSETHLNAENSALNALQKAFLTIERDFQQQFNHPAFADSNTPNNRQTTQQPLITPNTQAQQAAEQELLQIKVLPGNGSAPQNIRYYTSENTLYRQKTAHTQAADTATTTGTGNNPLLLLAGITTAEARLINTTSQNTAQKGIELRVQHEALGNINRVFALRPTIEAPKLNPQAQPQSSATNQTNGNTGPGSGSTTGLSDEDRALMNDN